MDTNVGSWSSGVIRFFVVLLVGLVTLSGLALPVSADSDEPKPRKTKEHRQAGSREFQIATVSTRNDVVSGGDVLVRIGVSQRVRLDRVAVELNGADVTGAFKADAASRSLLGLVTGLRVGDNRLVAREGRRASLRITNWPITGPIFSGPHEQPFICQTETFAGGGLGPPLDENCSAPTRVRYRYRATDGTLKDLPDLTARPADVGTVHTLSGATVPYIIRIERGTINRAIYETAILHDPVAHPTPDPWSSKPGWNGRLIYTFGGGCQPGWYVQGRTTGGVTDDAMLAKGYGVASASLNVLGNNCNDMLAAETAMMVKERFIENYGAPQYTIGFGCSGGSMQVHQIADNYPGILDGIIPGCSFPDIGFGGGGLDISDGHLLNNYFRNIAPGRLTEEQQRLVAGYGRHGDIQRDSDVVGRLGVLTDCPAVLPVELRYHPVTNPGGARCGIYDHTVNVYGRDPDTGFARRPLDNVGIQYGLTVLNAGVITKEQFLDLNEKVGGLDVDLNIVPDRTVGDRRAMRRAYETGRLMSGGGGLATTPIIDYRAYADLLPTGDRHKRHQSFITRERLITANGHADNQVMLHEDIRYGLFSTRSPLLREAISQMDEWLANLEADTSNDPKAVKVVRAKPAGLADTCIHPITGARITEPFTNDNSRGVCNTLFPVFKDPRLVANGAQISNVIKCRLKPIDWADYSVTFTPAERARLRATFPDGVCDWSRGGVEQRPLKGTWLSFGPAGAGDDEDD